MLQTSSITTCTGQPNGPDGREHSVAGPEQTASSRKVAGPKGSRRRMTMPMALVATVAVILASPNNVRAQAGAATDSEVASTPAPVRSGYVPANGVNYSFEVHGQGEPLLLLHGGLGSIVMFGPVLPRLAEGRQVIAVDLHGHGRTALGDRDISLIDMGDDLAVVLNELGYEQVDVLGYSMGGGVAFRLAVQHPEMVRRLALVSTGYAQDAFYPEILAQQAQVGATAAEAMKGTPMYESYVAVAPNPEDFPKLLEEMGALMREPFDWSEDVKKLEMPVMLVYGDSDMYRPEHIVDFYQFLGGGLRDAGWTGEHMSQNRLAILPGLTHYNIFLAPEMVATVLPFLDGGKESTSWADQVRQRN